MGSCTCHLGTWCNIRLCVCVCILRVFWPSDIAGAFWWRRWRIRYLLEDVRLGPFLGEFTRYLGLCVTGDFVWMDIPWYETIVCTHNLFSDMLVCGRAVWVRMIQETLAGRMFTRDETMVLTCFLGFDYAEDFERRMYRWHGTVRKGFWRVDVRAIFGPDSCTRYGRAIGVDVCACYVLFRRHFMDDGCMRYLGTGRGITLWVTYLPTYLPTYQHIYIHTYIHSLEH